MDKKLILLKRINGKPLVVNVDYVVTADPTNNSITMTTGETYALEPVSFSQFFVVCVVQ